MERLESYINTSKKGVFMKTKPINPYFLTNAKPEKNLDKVIVPAWVLSSFFDDYGVDEIELLRDEDPEALKFRMLKDGKLLKTCNPTAK
jgi:hypothetical protein